MVMVNYTKPLTKPCQGLLKPNDTLPEPCLKKYPMLPVVVNLALLLTYPGVYSCPDSYNCRNTLRNLFGKCKQYTTGMSSHTIRLEQGTGICVIPAHGKSCPRLHTFKLHCTRNGSRSMLISHHSSPGACRILDV